MFLQRTNKELNVAIDNLNKVLISKNSPPLKLTSPQIELLGTVNDSHIQQLKDSFIQEYNETVGLLKTYHSLLQQLPNLNGGKRKKSRKSKTRRKK